MSDEISIVSADGGANPVGGPVGGAVAMEEGEVLMAELAEAPLWAYMKIDTRRAPLANLSKAEAAILGLLKLLHIKLPIQSDLIAVTMLQPFEIPRRALTQAQWDATTPIVAELSTLGFVDAVYYYIPFPPASCNSLLVMMRHADDRAMARVTCQFLSAKPKPITFVQYLTNTAKGEVLFTWGRGFELFVPPNWQIARGRKRTPGELWKLHCQRMASSVAQAIAVPSQDALRQIGDQLQRDMAQVQIAKGLFVPLTDKDKQQLSIVHSAVGYSSATAANSALLTPNRDIHAEVMLEVAKQQNAKTSWWLTILILVVSGMAFVAAGTSEKTWDGQFMAILVGVLLVHEAGHFVAMKLSGYRNLKMFFIPFLGAAVSGRCYNVPGWKKVLVSLMGPMPGMIIAIPLGIAGIAVGSKLMMTIAFMMLALNGFNLLPVLPLDGGWIVHHLLFCRNLYLDIAFRAVAIVVLLGFSVATSGGRFTVYFAIMMAVQLPITFKLAKIVGKMRQAGFEPISHDAQTIPPEAAGPIIEQVKLAFPKQLTPKAAAQHTIRVFELLNSRPPGWAATTVFLIAHAGVLMMGIIFAIVFVGAMHGNLFKDGFRRSGSVSGTDYVANMRNGIEKQPLVSPVLVSQVGRNPALKTIPPVTIVGTYASREAALAASIELGVLPPGARACVFGNSVIVSLPVADKPTKEAIYDTINAGAKDTFAATDEQGVIFSFTLLKSDAKNEAFITHLGSFLSSPEAARRYAPWDSNDPRSLAEKEQAVERQEVYARIAGARSKWYSDPACADLGKKMMEARKRGGKEEVAALKDQQLKLQEKLFNETLDQAAADYPRQVAMIDAFRKLATRLNDQIIYKVMLETASPWMAQMNDSAGNVLGAGGSYASQDKTMTNISIKLLAPTESARLVIGYLNQNGISEMHYVLSQGYSAKDEAAMAEEED